jgi:hypothetical protein
MSMYKLEDNIKMHRKSVCAWTGLMCQNRGEWVAWFQDSDEVSGLVKTGELFGSQRKYFLPSQGTAPCSE